MNSVDEDDDPKYASSSDGSSTGGGKWNRRGKDNSSQIYGVFGESSSDDNDEYGKRRSVRREGGGKGQQKREQHGRSRNRKRGGIRWKRMDEDDGSDKDSEDEKKDLSSVFVKSTRPSSPERVDEQTIPSESIGDDNINDGDGTTRTNDDVRLPPTDGGQNEGIEEDDETRSKRQMEDDEQKEKSRLENERNIAEARFHSLLEKARGRRATNANRNNDPNKNNSHTKTVSNNPPQRDGLSSSNPTPMEHEAFGSTGEGGIGFHKSSSSSSPSNTPSSTTTTTTPSLSSFFQSSSAMSQFVTSTSSYTDTKPAVPTKRDPTIGTWEKHTRGIGMKLMAKMGYKGSGGLGSKKFKASSQSSTNHDTTRKPTFPDVHSDTTAPTTQQTKTGISRTIEVVVRPQNLGLGYGTFREATKLKINQRINDEMRGIDWKTREQDEQAKDRDRLQQEMKDEGTQMGGERYVVGASLPTTKSLLDAGGFRRGESNSRKRKRKRNGINEENVTNDEVRFVSYRDIIQGTTTTGDKKKELVIDMRGPTNHIPSSVPNTSTTTTDNDDDPNVPPPLGTELLHNVTYLLHSHESKLRMASQFLRSAEDKTRRLVDDIQTTERTIDEFETRRVKLTKVGKIVEDVEALYAERGTLFRTERGREMVGKLMSALGGTFTEEERESLRYVTTLVPELLGPIVETMLKGWDPLADGVEETRGLMQDLMELCARCSTCRFGTDRTDDNDTTYDASKIAIQKTIFLRYVLPLAIKSFQSSKWDPTTNVDGAIDLYETILGFAEGLVPRRRRKALGTNEPSTEDGADCVGQESVFSQILDEEKEESGVGGASPIASVKDAILFNVVYHRLSRSLNSWKPTLTRPSNNSISSSFSSYTLIHSPPHQWIIPWLPHLDHKSMLFNLIPEIKRRVENTISFLSKERRGDKEADEAFFEASTAVLKPWYGLLEKAVVHGITSRYIVPRLGRYLCRVKLPLSAVNDSHRMDEYGSDKHQHEDDKNDQRKVSANLPFRMYDDGLLSSREFLGLVEGELLLRFASELHGRVASRTIDAVGAAEGYAQWKRWILCDPVSSSSCSSMISTKSFSSREVLRQDAYVCRIFYGYLRIITAAAASLSDEEMRDTMDDLDPIPDGSTINYGTVLARRAKEDRLREEEEELAGTVFDDSNVHDRTRKAMASRPVFHGRAGVTFRDVVEEAARHEGVPFYPKTGPSSTRDGKDVFVLGNEQVYLDSNVVYVCKGKDVWRPTSLDELLSLE